MYLVSLLKEMSTFILRKYFYSGIGSHLENSRHFEKNQVANGLFKQVS